jgi:hypothetical protein
MKKLLLILFLGCSLVSFAQDEEEQSDSKGFKKENLFFGGNFGLTFGTNTLINISPQVGYRFSKMFAAGVGINGQYINQKIYYTNGQEAGNVKLGVAGLNLFGRFYPMDQLLIQLQPEANYIWGNETIYGANPATTKRDAIIVPSLLVGGGAVFPSGRGAFIASVFYDVVQDPNSPYGARPFYSFGYNINLR